MRLPPSQTVKTNFADNWGVVNEQPAGLLGVADPIKETTQEAIEQLHREGLSIVMLTGDNRTTAEAMTFSSVSVITNALRLRKVKL